MEFLQKSKARFERYIVGMRGNRMPVIDTIKKIRLRLSNKVAYLRAIMGKKEY